MKCTLTSFAATLLLFCCSQGSKAAHYSGGSLTYECVGGNFFRINLDLYLDCSGNPLTAQNLNLSNDCGVVFALNNIPVILNEEVSQLCAPSLASSTCNGGALNGLRHYRLQTTAYLSPCANWKIAWSICCRNASVNLANTPGIYLETTVNNPDGSCDRSPVVADQTFPVVCVNQPVLYNPGFNDPDGNTMAFSLIEARFAAPAPTPAGYQTGFTGAQPIPGIVLDPLTGQLSFTPMITGNYIIVMKVTTYTEGGSVIGTVMRDFLVTVVNCMGAAPQTTGPILIEGGTLVGAHGLAVCDGFPFCVDLTFTDADASEMITFASNATTLLPGATFNVVGLDPAVGTLCWTPDLAHPRTNVHFRALDGECPIPNVASTSILITVEEVPTVFPDAGENGTLVVCPSDPPTSLFMGLEGTPEGGGTWSFEGTPHGPNYDASVDVPGVYTYTVVGASPCAMASAEVNVLEGEGSLILEFQSGNTAPNTVTYEVLDGTGTNTVLSGTNPAPINSFGTLAFCLADGCYQLRVTDAGGDGLAGYILRETGANGRRIIDNAGNMSDGVSQIANAGTFCVPLGTDRPIFSSCDKLDWVTNKFIVATENAAVSGQYGVTNTTSGYEFWFFDPNGTYSFRRFRNHATSDGTGTGALRANHFRLNAWTNTPSTPHLPSNVLLNVRIRGRVAGVNQEFGPACRFKIDPALAACPRVSLQDNPLSNDYSCGVNKFFGGSNQAGNRITATPPQPIPTVISANVRYQFRFRIPGESICIVRPPQTSATFYLNWSAASGPQLQCSRQYEVDVRVSLDGGATWCFGGAVPSCVEPVTPWGKVCMVNITTSTFCPSTLQGGSSNIGTQGGTLTLYPNPNRGDRLYINLTKLGADMNTASVDIYDMTGKRVSARTIGVQDGFVRATLELNQELSAGLYLVNVTAGEKTYTERLVIQP